MCFKGTNSGFKNWSIEKKLECDLKLIDGLANNYKLITKLVLLAKRNGFKLIIENPYSKQHFLTRYWALEPGYIDMNRHENGDFYKKPTQYFFVNCKPQNNLLFEPVEIKKLKK